MITGQNTGLSLVDSDHGTRTMASHWSRVITGPEMSLFRSEDILVPRNQVRGDAGEVLLLQAGARIFCSELNGTIIKMGI